MEERRNYPEDADPRRYAGGYPPPSSVPGSQAVPEWDRRTGEGRYSEEESQAPGAWTADPRHSASGAPGADASRYADFDRYVDPPTGRMTTSGPPGPSPTSGSGLTTLGPMGAGPGDPMRPPGGDPRYPGGPADRGPMGRGPAERGPADRGAGQGRRWPPGAVPPGQGTYRTRRPALAIFMAIVAAIFEVPAIRVFADAAFRANVAVSGVASGTFLIIGLPMFALGLYALATGPAWPTDEPGFSPWLRPPVAYLTISLALFLAAGFAAG